MAMRANEYRTQGLRAVWHRESPGETSGLVRRQAKTTTTRAKRGQVEDAERE